MESHYNIKLEIIVENLLYYSQQNVKKLNSMIYFHRVIKSLKRHQLFNQKYYIISYVYENYYNLNISRNQ